MNKTAAVAHIEAAKAVAVIRLTSGQRVVPVTEALLKGDVTVIEVTLTTPRALAAVEMLVRKLSPPALVGVGSVLHAGDVALAADCGARFIVSPITTQAMIECAQKRGMIVMAGAFTPTEAHRAQTLGADFVKVFPAGFWGPKYLGTLLAPMPHLRLCPTGGVTPENAGDWIKAGAVAVGVGSALVDQKAVRQGRYDELTRRARILVNSVASARDEL